MTTDVTVERCPYCQFAAEMIRIKDQLIAEMSSRIIYLEARRDR